MADNKTKPADDFVDSRLIEKGLIDDDFLAWLERKAPLGQQPVTLEQRADRSVAILAYFMGRHPGRIALASSLSLEDQTITYMMVGIDPQARIFTLDTGRLFPQTYRLIDRTCLTYGIKMEVFFPDYREVQRMVREEGINLFLNSVASRHRCCAARKLEPLRRALGGLDVWVCGLRREQAVTRRSMRCVEWDDMHGLIKLNPLIDWTEEEVRQYVHEHHVPYSKLFDEGYPSVGCEPCTRAVAPGEDPRAGRWWWEAPEKRECGLHQRY